MSKTCKGGENCCSRDFPCAEVKRLLKSECKDVHSVLMQTRIRHACILFSVLVLSLLFHQNNSHEYFKGEGDCDRDDQCNSGLICVPER